MSFKTVISYISALQYKKFLNSFLDLIYRKKCYFCGNSKHSLKMCPKCYEKLEFSDTKANRIIDGSDIYCAGVYTKELQKLIRGLKYHRQKELAYYLAKFMYEYFCRLEYLKEKDFVIIPTPMHPNRVKKRKYNHMDLVCEEFSKLSGFECRFDLIKRVKDTKPQYKLSRKERLKNLSEAFEVDKNALPAKPVLILDDICTTGSTFEEMIKALKKSGVENITCLAASTPV